MPLMTLSYSDASENQKRAGAGWPRDSQARSTRLRPFCLPRLSPSFSIGKDDLVFTIGSCFARNIEQHLVIEGFNVAVSQFEKLCDDEGVKIKSVTLNKFVAQSILNELQWALEPDHEFPWGSIVEVRNGRFLDMQLAAGLMPTAKETMLAMRRAVLNYMKMIKDAKVIIITLGLAEAWFDKEYGIYMNTMPLKATVDRYPDRFEFHLLEYNELVASLREIVKLLEKHGHPDFRVLLTVSPVALGSTFTKNDAFVANTYSKAVQRAAAEQICLENERVDYLPSYESVTLSERPVAWREDGAHVSDDAVRLNVLRMQRAYLERSDLDPQIDDDEASAQVMARGEALKLTQIADERTKAGDSSIAGSLYSEAAALAPDEVLVLVRWGHFLFEQKQYADAAEQLKRSIELGGRKYKAAYTLARCFVQLNDDASAEEALRMAIADEPERASVVFLMAKTLARLGKGEEAQNYFMKAIELQPEKKGSALSQLGSFLLSEQKYEEAAIRLKQAMELGACEHKAAFLLAKCLTHLNDDAGAEKALRMAIEDEPERASIFYLLGKTLVRLGRQDEARAYFLKASELQPGDENFQKAVERVGG